MSAGDTRFDVHIPADPRWYHAHFPGQPIVPGVVLLAALQAGCRDALGNLGTLRAVRHLRFLQPVRAPATLQASVQVRGEWLHCTLAEPAGGGGDVGAVAGPASATAGPARVRRGVDDVLRAQLQFDPQFAAGACATHPAPANDAG